MEVRLQLLATIATAADCAAAQSSSNGCAKTARWWEHLRAPPVEELSLVSCKLHHEGRLRASFQPAALDQLQRAYQAHVLVPHQVGNNDGAGSANALFAMAVGCSFALPRCFYSSVRCVEVRADVLICSVVQRHPRVLEAVCCFKKVLTAHCAVQNLCHTKRFEIQYVCSALIAACSANTTAGSAVNSSNFSCSTHSCSTSADDIEHLSDAAAGTTEIVSRHSQIRAVAQTLPAIASTYP
eukprot:17021-Heterococcus_DN1.PRE.1